MSERSPPRHGGQDRGDGGAGQDGVDHGAAREAKLLAVDDIDHDDVQRDRHVLESLELHVSPDQPPQRRLWYEVVASAEEAEQSGDGVQREDLSAPQVAPDIPDSLGGGNSLGSRGDENSVYGPGGGADDEVRCNPTFVEGVQESDLDGAEARPAGEHERCGWLLAAAHDRSASGAAWTLPPLGSVRDRARASLTRV
jgi:hypothetical protein